ncbi:MAG: DUF2225 domain-containing protein [Treponemataceae bacterium]
MSPLFDSSKEEKELKITFYSKEAIHCPICDASFYREELLSGGGRLIAGPLTDELHRIYEPSAKYGDVHPLVYSATVCPSCWFASSDTDFSAVPEKVRPDISADREARIADTQSIFTNIDFSGARTLEDGAASQYLALRCYGFYTKEFSPTLKQGMSALRAAWLFDELHKKSPTENFDWLSLLFKRKACFLYHEAILKEQSGKEPLSGVKNFGPDSDKNYAYEGALYLVALLESKYGDKNDPEKRLAALADAKRSIAKIFGLGKSSKAKPGPLLEKARNLYDDLNKELNETDD